MRKIIFFSILLLLGCQENSTKQTTPAYFDLPGFTNSIMANMALRRGNVTKTFVLNEQAETKDFIGTDSLFWSKELSWLLKTDLNAPKFRGALAVSLGQEDTKSNLLVDRISSTNEDSEFREIELYYLDELSEMRIIRIKMGTKNFIATSRGQMTVWLNRYNDLLLIDSLVTSGRDKVLFQDERDYKSHLERIRE